MKKMFRLVCDLITAPRRMMMRVYDKGSDCGTLEGCASLFATRTFRGTALGITGAAAILAAGGVTSRSVITAGIALLTPIYGGLALDIKARRSEYFRLCPSYTPPKRPHHELYYR